MVQKKTAASASRHTSTRAPSSHQLKSQIEKLDHQILKALNERARLAVDLAKAKGNDDSSQSAEREDDVLPKILGDNKGPLDERSIRAIFREILSGSRAIQRTPRVAYLGTPYSLGHLAAIEKFGESVEYVAVGTVSGAFEAVNRRQVDMCVVPIENSPEGRITDTLEMFSRHPFRICDEVAFRVHHCLLAMCPQSEIRRVYGRPQELAACQNWISTNLPQAQTREVANATTAVQLAKQEPYAAAVSSRQAAASAGLNIICSDIEDKENNITRFAVIGSQTRKRSGKDKTSLMFQLSDQPGTLIDALLAFKKNRVNMTWIESIAGSTDDGKPGYTFFVDILGHADDPKIKRTLGALERKCKKLTILGSYPSASSHE